MLGNLVVSPRKLMAGNEPTTNNRSITNSCETHIIYGTKQPTYAENICIYIYMYVYIIYNIMATISISIL